MSTDTEHYATRERQARALAGGAADPRIAAIHVAMADVYKALVGEATGAGRGEPGATAAPTRGAPVLAG